MKLCPFSSKVCVQCGLYRGRHLYLCIAGPDRDRDRRASTFRKRAPRKEKKGSGSPTFGIPPHLPNMRSVISNVENLVEGQELDGPETTRRKA
jgi:hypothetical protein